MYSVLTNYIEILCFINLFVGVSDTKMDSPGFNASFYPCVLMNNDNLDILDMVAVDKREMGLKSTNMEKEGLIRGLEHLFTLIVFEIVMWLIKFTVRKSCLNF